jgi:carboxylesterase
MPVMPGAEPYYHDGGPVGALLCHGFTGTPQSLRPWAQYLADAGLSVSLPRLPGHGISWQEMARTRWEDWYAEVDREFNELATRVSEVFVMGLSLGACLALRLAEVHGDAISGLVLVNPSLIVDGRHRLEFAIAPVLKRVLPSVKAIADDIKKEGSRELAYDRTSTKAAASLPGIWNLTRRGLRKVTQPVLAYKSREDHVVGPASLAVLRSALPESQLTVRMCDNSYHVATLDNDAPAIFEGSLEFVRAHSHAGKG